MTNKLIEGKWYNVAGYEIDPIAHNTKSKCSLWSMSDSGKWSRMGAGCYVNGRYTIAKGSWLTSNGYAL